MFINRDLELAQLERLYSSSHADMFVLYGRRRVGKTELLRAFSEKKRHIFFIATMSSDLDLLATFSQAIWGFTHTNVPEGFTFPSWEAALQALADLPGRPVVIIDEFTYLISGNKAVPSILQKVWDETLRNTRIFLILCGSYIGMMEREVLNYGAPLYGRRTGSYLLESLELPAVADFFPRYDPLQRIEAWAVLGGMPYYLRTFSDVDDIFTNIREHVLDIRGTLYNEPQLLLMEELREPRNYFSILRAIAHGNTRLSAVTQAAGVGNSSTTARYLDVLQQLHLVRRIVPATERRPEKSKKGLYKIVDRFLRFWFRYVHPHQGTLSLGLADAVLDRHVRPTFDDFVGHAFEDAARQYVTRLARSGELPILPERIGSWWSHKGEIDVVAVSDAEKSVLAGECKWSSKQVGTNVLDDLKRKTREMNSPRRWERVSYAIFSKSGFTSKLQEIAKDESVQLVEAPELIRKQ